MSHTHHEFIEQISPYLVQLTEKVKMEKGEDSSAYKALYNQYTYSESEQEVSKEKNIKHYEASVEAENEVRYIERLYKRQIVIDITSICSAHCRYCLRQNYELIHFSEEDVMRVAEYCKKETLLREVLITGGDPLVVPKTLISLIKGLMEHAPNIEIIRIGTRLLVHNPLKISPDLFEFFNEIKDKVKLELGLQVNHSIELQPEVREAVRKFQKAGVTFYSQNVLLKNVNDSLSDLVDLYDELRYLNIEAHYLFHPIPMQGTKRFRMPIDKGLKLIRQLTASGEVSGRIKPMFSLMTDAGKVTLYEGTLGEKDKEGYYNVRTSYRLEDRVKWNPSYKLPENAFIDEEGYIVVKYLDGEE